MRTEFEEVAQATREGRHADALRLLLELFDLADRSPRDHGLVFMTMFQWEQLLEVYAPAREAMRRVREQQAQRLLASEKVFGDPLAQLAQLNESARIRPLVPPANEPPRLAAELGNFVKEVRLLCGAHRGLQRPGEAEALQAAALAGIESDDLRGWAVRELAEPGMLLREVAARHGVAP